MGKGKKRTPWVSGVGIKVRDESVAVTEPTGETEFEIQAFVWCELRRLGYRARGEVKSAFAGRACVRFDVAVFDDGVLVAIVEVKRNEARNKAAWAQSRQGSRYEQFNVPVHIICGMTQAREFIASIENGPLRLFG